MPRPARISRDRVVAAALDLVDARGIDGLTMRALAKELGVDPMAVYRHVRDKDDLLGAMCDALVADLGPLDPDAPWAEQLRGLALRLRERLVARPALVPVLVRAPVTPAALALTAQGVALLEAAGMPDDLAAAGFGVVFSYVVGFAAVEAAMPPPSPDAEGLVRAAAARLGHPGDTPPPHVVRALALLDDPGDFALGLDLLLDGIARRAASAAY